MILNIAKNTPNRETYYNSLRKRIAITNNFDTNMYFCRKVFATYLRNAGIEQEIIDLLQGRMSHSVFVNHYYRQNISDITTNKVKPVLKSLFDELLSL
jgi:intergrase/recombinase